MTTTSFQKYLSYVLKEQVDQTVAANQIGQIGTEMKPLSPGSDMKPVGDNEAPETYPEGTELPNGFRWDPDCNGGEGCWTDDSGVIYTLTTISYIDSAGNVVWAVVPTKTIGNYMVAWTNGSWQVVGTTANGNNYLVPNMWAFSFGTGQTFVFTQTGTPPNAQFFITSGDPFANPPQWYNIATGALNGGVGVDYPSWAVEFGFYVDVNGNPVGGTWPLLPGGGDMSPILGPIGSGNVHSQAKGEGAAAWFQVSYTGGDPDKTNEARHRRNWSHFVAWYMSLNPDSDGVPENYWPTGAGWWDAWSSAQGGDYYTP